MRKWLAGQLQRLATWIYNTDHTELIEVHDEYGICRCRVEIVADDFTHGVEATFVQLPADWTLEGEHDCGRPHPYRHRHRPHR